MSEYDYVNPEHYKNNDNRETWEQMIDIWGVEAYKTFCEMNAFKYISRLGKKPNQPVQRDLDKATWYLKKAEEVNPNNKE